MRKKKYILFTRFASYDRAGIERFLEKQAKKGWMLESLHNGWCFRRTEPKEVRFSVYYFPGLSEYDAEPTYKQKQFIELCAHTGWILAAYDARMHIFYNEAADPVPIETDPVEEVELIHQSTMKQEFRFRIYMIFACLLRLLFDSPLQDRYPLTALSSGLEIMMYLFWLVLFLILAIDITEYLLWYRKAKRVARNEGRFYPCKSKRSLQCFLLLIPLAAFIAVWFNPQEYALGLTMLLSAVAICAILALRSWLRDVMKNRGVPNDINEAVTVISCIVGIFVVSGIVTSAHNSGTFDFLKPESVTYLCEYEDHTHKYSLDPIPLRVEDLTGDTYAIAGYSTSSYESASFLLGDYRYYQSSCQNSPGMNYTILEIKFPPLHDYCQDTMLHRYAYEYRIIEENQFGMNVIYQKYADDEPVPVYLLCGEDRIIELYTDWLLTEEQLTIVSEKLTDCPLPVS